MRDDSRFRRAVVIGIALLAISIFISVYIGNGTVSAGDLIKASFGNSQEKTALLILTRIRIPRTIAAILCGVALSVAGLVLQTVLDNPLASPGIIGINSGAGLFVLFAGIIFPFSAAAKQLFAFAGAIAAVMAVYMICRLAGFSKMTLILTGVAVSSLFAAGSNTVITFNPNAVTDKTAFSLGGLSQVSLQGVLSAIPWIVISIIYLFVRSGELDLLPLGDEVSSGLGADPVKLRRISLIIAAVLAGAAVSLCGLLSFVGLIVPNLIRRICNVKTSHQLILCIVYGSSFLVICDCMSRYLFYPYEIPVGLILSVIGAPFFIWILIRRKRLAA